MAICICKMGEGVDFAMEFVQSLRHGCAVPPSSIQHGRLASSHRAAFSGPLFRGCALRFAPCARHFSPSGLRCAQSALAMLPVSLGSSYRPALRWPGIPGLRSASRCPRPSTPSGLRRLRPVSRTARGLRAPLLNPCYYIRAPRPRQPVAARDNSLPKLYNGKAMA